MLRRQAVIDGEPGIPGFSERLKKRHDEICGFAACCPPAAVDEYHLQGMVLCRAEYVHPDGD